MGVRRSSVYMRHKKRMRKRKKFDLIEAKSEIVNIVFISVNILKKTKPTLRHFESWLTLSAEFLLFFSSFLCSIGDLECFTLWSCPRTYIYRVFHEVVPVLVLFIFNSDQDGTNSCSQRIKSRLYQGEKIFSLRRGLGRATNFEVLNGQISKEEYFESLNRYNAIRISIRHRLGPQIKLFPFLRSQFEFAEKIEHGIEIGVPWVTQLENFI